VVGDDRDDARRSPHALYCAAFAAILASAFPSELRCVSISMWYQRCAMLFSATARFLCQLLSMMTRSAGSVAAVGVFCVLVTVASCGASTVPRSNGVGTNN
jgi:hypothetical protein